MNAQLYVCNASEPWRSRQRWDFKATGPSVITLSSSGEVLQVQLPSPSLATTCPTETNASCWNLIVGPAAAALQFTLIPSSKQLVVASAGAVHGLCMTNSNSGTVSDSNGYLANVFLTECSTAAAKASSWELNGTTIRSPVPKSSAQCLDVGSAGSSGDLGFEFKLKPAATLEKQAFHSDKWVSWGGSVIQDPDTKKFNMFAAVFEDGKGLDAWMSNSEIMHLVADTPSGPFKPTTNGNKSDGVIVIAEAHNPTIIRASDGTYLLFSIGHSPFLTSASLDGPWAKVRFPTCNNPTPLVIPERPEVYVYCHGGPDENHWGSSVGMTWTPHWASGIWHTASNNTDDIHGGGKDLIGHPVEDPFAWYAPSTNPNAPGSFHLLGHGFRMGMVNNSDGAPRIRGHGTTASTGSGAPCCLCPAPVCVKPLSCCKTPDPRSYNGYGAYANAPTPFGPWHFQEARVVYNGHVELTNGKSLGKLGRRERPHLLLNKQGVPTHLYNGVCLGDDGYNQNSAGHDHCFTFVQEIGQ